jgi:Right handed beta helix region
MLFKGMYKMNSNYLLSLMYKCTVKKNYGNGIECRNGSYVILNNCQVNQNNGDGLCLSDRSVASIQFSIFERNGGMDTSKGLDCTVFNIA